MDIVTRMEKTEEILRNHPRAKSESLNTLPNWKFKNLVKWLENDKSEKIWSVNDWGYMVSKNGKLKSYSF